MTSVNCKMAAQEALMQAMMAAFTRMADAEIDPAIIAEARKQARRVEKLFGYEPGSWK